MKDVEIKTSEYSYELVYDDSLHGVEEEKYCLDDENSSVLQLKQLNLDSLTTVEHENANQVIEVKTKKSVSFNTNLRVILIPSIVDYHAAGLVTNLWWCSADYKSFQAAAFSELKLLSVFEGVDMNSAKKLLYQPGIWSKRNESSFDDAMSGSAGKGIDGTGQQCCHDDLLLKRAATGHYNNQSLKSMSSDGNLCRMSETVLRSFEIETKKMTESLSSYDDALSLCVPLDTFFPLPHFDKYRSRRSLRRRSRVGDFSIGVATVIALGLLLVPVVFGMESFLQSGI